MWPFASLFERTNIAFLCVDEADLYHVLQIVGNLIRTFGDGWEEEIPSVLKKDMKSLTAGEGAANNQSLNLQQRVIQSGLDSLAGADAENIVLLFKVQSVLLCIYINRHTSSC